MENKIVRGTCTQMCPENEIYFREKNNLLWSFETCNSKNSRGLPKADFSKCIKEFRRSAAGEVISLSKNIRTPEILLKTTEYLLELLFTKSVSYEKLYDFIFDRLRSVRQDVSIQQLHEVKTEIFCKVIWKCIKFYAYSCYRCAKDKITLVDMHINNSHLKETMNSLATIFLENPNLLLYDETNVGKELMTCYLLYNFSSLPTILFILQKVPISVQKSNPLKLAIDICMDIINNNVIKFKRHAKELINCKSQIICLFLYKVIEYVRNLAFLVLSQSHGIKTCKFPIDKLQSWLLLENNLSVIEYCKYFNVDLLDQKFAVFTKTNPPKVELSIFWNMYSQTVKVDENDIMYLLF